MTRVIGTLAAAWLWSLTLTAQAPQVRPAIPAAATGQADAATQTVRQYCIGCHGGGGKSGELSLANLDVEGATDRPDVAEKMIRKLRAHMMPPAGARRPDESTLLALRRELEARMDRWAAANPNPGW